jgi:hypothetical protein
MTWAGGVWGGCGAAVRRVALWSDPVLDDATWGVVSPRLANPSSAAESPPPAAQGPAASRHERACGGKAGFVRSFHVHVRCGRAVANPLQKQGDAGDSRAGDVLDGVAAAARIGPRCVPFGRPSFGGRAGLPVVGRAPEARKARRGSAGRARKEGAMRWLLLVDPVVCGANYYAESAAVIGGPPPKTCGFRFT